MAILNPCETVLAFTFYAYVIKFVFIWTYHWL